MSTETIEQLIELVKHYPCLYNAKEPNFKNTEFKDKMWDEIGGILCEDGKSVKKKYKNLRDCYTKYLRSQTAPNEQNARYQKWQWAHQIEYLKPFISPDQFYNIQAQKFNNIKKSGSQSKKRNNCSEEYEKQKPKQQQRIEDPKRKHDNNPSLKLRSLRTKISTQATEAAAKFQEMDSSETKHVVCQEFSANEYIFLGYAKTINKFPPKRQAIIKLQFAQIIMEHELEHEQELEETQQPTTQFYLNNIQSESSNTAAISPTLMEDNDEKNFI